MTVAPLKLFLLSDSTKMLLLYMFVLVLRVFLEAFLAVQLPAAVVFVGAGAGVFVVAVALAAHVALVVV